MKRTNDQKLSEVIKEFAEQKQYKHKLQVKKIETVWLELFGEITKGYLDRIKVQNNILTVYLSSPTLRVELDMNKKLILQNLNKKLGNDQLDELIFR